MSRINQLNRLQKQLNALNIKKGIIETQIQALLLDPAVKQEEEFRLRSRAIGTYPFAPSYYLDRATEVFCYEGGLRNLSALIAWLNTPTPAIPGMDKRRINRAIGDLRTHVQRAKAEEYGRAVLRGEYELSVGMQVHFIEAALSRVQKALGYNAYGIVTDVDQAAHSVSVTLANGYRDETVISVDIHEITEVHPAELMPTLFPLKQCDEHELLSWPIPDYMLSNDIEAQS